MSTTIQTWYDFVLQQMAAESYLDGWNSLSLEDKIIRLNLGSNNFSIPANLPTKPTLPGATRMTAIQADQPKGVSITILLKQPCHVDHALN